MATTVSEREQFVGVMVSEFGERVRRHLPRLLTLAKRHARLQETACNRQVAENHDARCEAAIAALCETIGCTVQFSGDPRGYTVKLHLPSGRYNTWGGFESGYGVPQ